MASPERIGLNTRITIKTWWIEPPNLVSPTPPKFGKKIGNMMGLGKCITGFKYVIILGIYFIQISREYLNDSVFSHCQYRAAISWWSIRNVQLMHSARKYKSGKTCFDFFWWTTAKQRPNNGGPWYSLFAKYSSSSGPKLRQTFGLIKLTSSRKKPKIPYFLLKYWLFDDGIRKFHFFMKYSPLLWVVCYPLKANSRQLRAPFAVRKPQLPSNEEQEKGIEAGWKPN